MRTVRSSSGEEQAVTVRRTESADAREIDALLGPSSPALFGRVDVLHLLERANLAVTLASERGEVVGHACFLDHPIAGLVDQEHWESYLHKHFHAGAHTPLNTLFLHLFVAQPGFAPDSIREILRAVFHATAELHYICLVSPQHPHLDPVLEKVFEPLKTRQDPPPCLALVSYRHQYCPGLHVRQARVEDHDDLLQIFSEQCTELSDLLGSFSLAQLIEDQNQQHQAAVCESGGAAVGFMSVRADLDVEELDHSFDLSAFGGLYKPTVDPPCGPDDPTDPGGAPEGGQRGAPGGSARRPNVFCIQMFVVDKDHETRSLDFLPYVFKLFPDQDLCVVTVPRLAPEGPLLQGFQRVPPRPSSTPTQELYLFHRTGLLNVVVRRAVSEDRAAVCDLVAGFKGQQSVLEDLDLVLQARRDPEGLPVEAFVAQVERQVVGVLILSDEEDVDFLRAHYNMDSFVYFSQHSYQEHGRLLHFSLLPLFQRHARHFLKEVLRLAHKTCLSLRTYCPLHHPQQRVHSEDCLLDRMAPLAPRRQVVYPLEELGLNAPSRRITQQQDAFAVRLLSRKLTLEPQVVLNTRVVVVGASETALAFLEVLALWLTLEPLDVTDQGGPRPFRLSNHQHHVMSYHDWPDQVSSLLRCPHLRFTSLTLVSPHGFPDNCLPHDAHFLSTSSPTSRCSESELLAVRACVSVVTGRMEALQRDLKQVVLGGGAVVPYDHLVICTGLQYQLPCPTEAQPGDPQSLHGGPVPPNLLTLTDQQDCLAARDLVSQEVLERGGNAVVYGRSLDAYTCVEALLIQGVPGSRVHLVLPPGETGPAPCCFGDGEVGRAVGGALREAGVAVHPDCVLARMDVDQTSGKLAAVSFSTHGSLLHLPCGVLVNMAHEGVDRGVFLSVHRAGLVFDGRLVIDPTTFLTADPAVRAAGPLTKFPRRHRAAGRTHALCSSGEVGRALAAAMLALLDPTVDPPASDPLIPEYSQARVRAGRIPGGFHYLHVTKPWPLPPAPQAPSHQGWEVVTGAVETGNYFRVHLDRYQVVDGLTCLSREPLPLSNYLCLYGRHQLMLNHLLLRSQQGLLPDLYSLFREPWSLALFHDRFADLEQEVQQGLASAPLMDSRSGTELLLRLPGRPPLLGEEAPVLLLSPQQSRALRSSALNYLSFNQNLLPMYAPRTPGPLSGTGPPSSRGCE